jgi:hypothetical protein
MPTEKSQDTTSAPASRSLTLDAPVPAARSRIFSPFRGAIAATVAGRQYSFSRPIVATALVRSYPSATLSNMAATSCGCLVRSARVTCLVHHAAHDRPDGRHTL